MKREQSVVLIYQHLIIISVSILRANGSLCDTWYQFAGGIVTVFDHFVVVCNTGRLCDEDSGEATALTRIIHPIHFIQPSRNSFTVGCPRKGFFLQKSVDPLRLSLMGFRLREVLEQHPPKKKIFHRGWPKYGPVDPKNAKKWKECQKCIDITLRKWSWTPLWQVGKKSYYRYHRSPGELFEGFGIFP